MSRKDGTNPRALGTNPRARGISKRKLNTNPKRQKRVEAEAAKRNWSAEASPPKDRILPRWLRFEILKRDRFTCTYCGRGATLGAVLQVDHVTPRAEGGTDEPSNLTTSCQDCNNGKGARFLDRSYL